jgi:hypothetical protein
MCSVSGHGHPAHLREEDSPGLGQASLYSYLAIHRGHEMATACQASRQFVQLLDPTYAAQPGRQLGATNCYLAQQDNTDTTEETNHGMFVGPTTHQPRPTRWMHQLPADDLTHSLSDHGCRLVVR